jgi:hypothetical protein
MERNREYHCIYFEIPFIKYPWPGNLGELPFDPRIVPENHEAIEQMIARNPVVKGEFKWWLEEWLHQESK